MNAQDFDPSVAQSGGPLPRPMNPEANNPFALPLDVAAVVRQARNEVPPGAPNTRPGSNIGGDLAVRSPMDPNATTPAVDITAGGLDPSIVRDSMARPVRSKMLGNAIRTRGAQMYGRT